MGGATTVPEAVLDATPSARAAAAVDALGTDVVSGWCADLLGGRVAWGDSDAPDVGWLAGRVGSTWGSPSRLDGDTRYWSRVWAARTLLHAGPGPATADVVAALADPAWRVREMAAKVCARWAVAEAADPCRRLVDDETPRVRLAALRVLAAVGEGEHAEAVARALDDTDPAVRDAAERALTRLEQRLDRPLHP
ncbi:HEAT repeat protein [Terracoccus luteus]|uniref:HEAT repeat protein n=1 Tax=Terracoccus luteus TaxID=53356 RepID=A0A495XW06_9MICO|nr:HEAT repeat domain-containing protein [Terracoccus luteus]RKT77689.1 HEAT repeat protein [Terracoccus luteus]